MVPDIILTLAGNVGQRKYVTSPAGDYYLSHAAAGWTKDSPAIDIGNDAVAAPGMFQQTTRSDETLDGPPVDLGYHFPVTGRQLMLGDWDRNGSVDLFDFAGFQNCFGGPDPGSKKNPDDALDAHPACRIFDFDRNRRVTSPDVLPFVAAMSK
jgi:hypothetical protein